MDPIILTFIIGGLFCYFKVPISIPKKLSGAISVFLLVAIGFKGGLELGTVDPKNFIYQALLVTLMGIILPLLAYPILKYIGKFDKKNAASIAAHYGSVSVGTFAVTIAYLDNLKLNFESYSPVFVAILEMPAIIVGILLARGFEKKVLYSKKILKELFLAKSILMILFGIFIGLIIGKDNFAPMTSSFLTLFKVILAIFLFDMGMVAIKELKLVRGNGLFLLSFGVITPLLFSVIGMLLGIFMGLSEGGAVILATLAASASYIAVPAAMKISIPEASPSLSLTASLGITFPFNVLVGIPIYYRMVNMLY